MKDLYALLGVKPEATPDEIRKAYHRFALELHPDRNPGDPEGERRFKEISAAYSCLIDPRSRQDYDRERLRPMPRPQVRPEHFRRAQEVPTHIAEAVAAAIFRNRRSGCRQRRGGWTFFTGKMEVGKTYKIRPDPFFPSQNVKMS